MMGVARPKKQSKQEAENFMIVCLGMNSSGLCQVAFIAG